MSDLSNTLKAWAREPVFKLPLAILDVETTGFHAESDRIIEIGIIHMSQGVVTGKYSSLVNPGQPIPKEVVELTGISDDDVKASPKFEEIAKDVVEALQGKIFVAYNLSFDRGFVEAELSRAGLALPSEAFLDPLVFARELQKGQGSHRLSAVAERLGVSLLQAHRAVDDAEATGKVFYKLLKDLPPHFEELNLLQAQWEALQANRRMHWRNQQGRSETASMDFQQEGGQRLGPAYLYNQDTDPVRAMFASLPPSGGAKKSD